jgi:hypothetical protein
MKFKDETLKLECRGEIGSGTPNCPWFKVRRRNTLHGVLLGMYDKLECRGEGGRTKYFQIRLLVPCLVETWRGNNSVVGKSPAGSIVNLPYDVSTKCLEKLVPELAEGAVYEVRVTCELRRDGRNGRYTTVLDVNFDLGSKNAPRVGKGEAASRDSLRDSHLALVRSSARAAAFSATSLKHLFLVRRSLARILVSLGSQMDVVGEAVAQGSFVPSAAQFDFSEKIFELGATDTSSARACLRFFNEHVEALHEAYESVRSSDPVWAFRVLRQVSRELLTVEDLEMRAAWKYVLLTLQKRNPSAAKIAEWQPGPGESREATFRFDEESSTWFSDEREGVMESPVMQSATTRAASKRENG